MLKANVRAAYSKLQNLFSLDTKSAVEVQVLLAMRSLF
ncbi:hypothetical protein AVDCRST_MAG92-3763 [uncultured Coleofasciculus sp.]|uniref:Uncharacterized protein n=1 Tax=uncultured Coleofasciculus sp. TaxID=1267456 RepID=A0A6J4JPW1_9CYAN|nr:hypothetical protein AVDCRST_MAG92-3763 [uncultured Coleofasciculus sp.]